MVRLSVLLPNKTRAFILVPDDCLVLTDKTEFTSVYTAHYLVLVEAPVEHPIGNIELLTEQYYVVQILSREVTDTETPEGNAIYVPDPTGGVCLCGVTCMGTNLSYVQVHQE